MNVFIGLKQIKRFKKPVVALGVFDGVHLAHRRLLQAVAKKAKFVKGTSIVVTFWPHPQKEDSLYSLEHRLKLIKGLGIDVCMVIRFMRKFARISAEDFVKEILVRKIRAQYIFVGRNFRFGRFARGDFRLLNRLSRIYNFKLKVFSVMRINHQTISSTYIRKLILKGDIQSAKRFLAQPVSVLGTVVKGVSLANRLGFPTANINPHHEVLPPSGVYAVKVIFKDKMLKGACYIGTKPTLLNQKPLPVRQAAKVKSKKEKHIEVHILDYNRDIYGKDLEIQFFKKIREEKKFVSYVALAKQIKKDILQVKKIISLQ